MSEIKATDGDTINIDGEVYIQITFEDKETCALDIGYKEYQKYKNNIATVRCFHTKDKR